MTPAGDGGRTPVYSSAWDPTVTNTPAHQPNDDINYDEPNSPFEVPTPGSLNPQTPGYNSDTPLGTIDCFFFINSEKLSSRSCQYTLLEGILGQAYTPMTPGGIYADYAAPSPYSRSSNNYDSSTSYGGSSCKKLHIFASSKYGLLNFFKSVLLKLVYSCCLILFYFIAIL